MTREPNWSSSSGRIELYIAPDDASACSHSGQCDADVEALGRKPYIVHQLMALDPGLVASELKEYGAWDAIELQDNAQNLQRLLWCAACDIDGGNC